VNDSQDDVNNAAKDVAGKNENQPKRKDAPKDGEITPEVKKIAKDGLE
jgi:hypothetical protein